MIALDTNVLVRFLVEDDKAQAAAATALVKRTIAAHEVLFVADVVLCEVVWVLEVAYKVPRTEIIHTLGQLLHARHLSFSEPERVARALASFSSGKGDFADYVIREQATAAGCDVVATFDGALLKEAGFEKP